MTELVYVLGAGVALEILTFVLLYRWLAWPGKQLALVVGLAAVLIYLPWGVARWRGLDYLAIHLAFFVTIPYVLAIITTTGERTAADAQTSRRGWFHWGPATLVGFFLVIATVDAIILTLAERGLPGSVAKRVLPEAGSSERISSFFPGTVFHDYHKKEALYNAYLSGREAQEQRGWRVRKGWTRAAESSRAETFRLEVVDAGGVPISDARVHGHFLRPSDHRLDLAFEMQSRGGGVYEVELTLPQPGRWSLVALIERGQAWHEVRAATTLQSPDAP
ncbi:MAG: FixH family protein [Thiotrichales bacterium]